MMIKTFNLKELFEIKSGDYHATKELDQGSTPLVSCGVVNNGLVGYFEIPRGKTYKNAITVAFNGLPLTAKFHPYRFGAKDDVAVLIPRNFMHIEILIYIAALLNNQKWRYSYGRKCFQNKLPYVEIDIPVTKTGAIDEAFISSFFNKSFRDFIPKTKIKKENINTKIKWKDFLLQDLFDIKNGSVHTIEDIDSGKTPLISCSEENNGICGNFLIDEVYENALTVTFDGRPITVRYHNYKFSAYDNVGILIPKKRMKKAILIFIGGSIAAQQWRYSYGRKCYKGKLGKLQIKLPVNEKGEIRDTLMEEVVNAVPYSDVVLKSRSY